MGQEFVKDNQCVVDGWLDDDDNPTELHFRHLKTNLLEHFHMNKHLKKLKIKIHLVDPLSTDKPAKP